MKPMPRLHLPSGHVGRAHNLSTGPMANCLPQRAYPQGSAKEIIVASCSLPRQVGSGRRRRQSDERNRLQLEIVTEGRLRADDTNQIVATHSWKGGLHN